VSPASPVKRATRPSMSPSSTMSAKRPTMSRSSLEFGSGARSRPAAGNRDSSAVRALLPREMLKADDECQRDRLLGLVARLRPGSLVRDAVDERVRVGLEPDRLAPVRRLRQLGHPLVFRAARARPQGIQRAVAGDPLQPGPDRRASLELFKPPPRGEQGLFGVDPRRREPSRWERSFSENVTLDGVVQDPT
jgi:hypothetical protein